MHAAGVSTVARLRSRPGTPTVLATALTLALLATATAGAQEWQKLPDMPVEKWEPGAVVLDGKLYLFAGYTDGVRSSRLAHVFDPADGSWTRIQDLPSAITHVNLVLDGRRVWFAGGFKDDGRIYMAGGHTTAPGESKQVDADILALSPGGEWEVVGTLPMPLSSPAAAIIDGRFYVAGGSPGRSAVQADMWVGRLP